jgi:hypothetical protein
VTKKVVSVFVRFRAAVEQSKGLTVSRDKAVLFEVASIMEDAK